ncbi:hypothetical protein [Vreelandella venusta]|uniref:hypothetical protein n=1 Tax=Vreelandella venusta TaxID=44935 RepID=UPI00228625F4|nr:hypothetical protein [Halomonas venusta]WAM50886.1 hypothetical protein L0520_11370 [Halomonas venusta]
MNQPATTTQQTDSNSHEGQAMETTQPGGQAPVKGGKVPGRKFNYFSPPDIAGYTTEEKLTLAFEKELKSYHTRRQKLTEACRELDRLKKTLSALEQQEKAADGEWKLSFVKGFGKQSKSVREKIKQKTQTKLEAEQIREMILLLEPQIQWLKMHTYQTRKSLVAYQGRLLELSAHNQLISAIDELSQNTDCMAKLAEVVPSLLDRIATDTCNDHGLMATLGIDASMQKGQGYLAVLSRDDTVQLSREINKRQMSALGELFLSRIPINKKRMTIPGIELPERLTYEDYDDGGYYSPIRFPQELKALEAQMGYVPSMEELDSDDTAA